MVIIKDYMKIMMAILAVFIMGLAAGCENSNDTPTGNLVNNSTGDKDSCPVCEKCVEKACPTCQTCPVCEKCEACEKCIEFGDNPVELSLTDVKLLKTDGSGSSEEVGFYYSTEKFKNVGSATLYFEPRCTSDQKLTIELNDEEVSDSMVVCGKENEVELDSELLESGRNDLSFTSSDKDGYSIRNIRVDTKYKDDTSDTQNLVSIKFDDVSDTEETFETFNAVKITNFVEYSVDMDEDDIKEDMVLEFVGDDTYGVLIINVNGEKVFEGSVNRRRDNEVTIPKDALQEGKNYITFIGIGD